MIPEWSLGHVCLHEPRWPLKRSGYLRSSLAGSVRVARIDAEAVSYGTCKSGRLGTLDAAFEGVMRTLEQNRTQPMRTSANVEIEQGAIKTTANHRSARGSK